MEDVDGTAFLLIGGVVGAIFLVLWLQHQSEQMNVDSRRWTVTWTVALILGAFAIYFLLT
jgi:hypothetical protein